MLGLLALGLAAAPAAGASGPGGANASGADGSFRVGLLEDGFGEVVTARTLHGEAASDLRTFVDEKVGNGDGNVTREEVRRAQEGMAALQKGRLDTGLTVDGRHPLVTRRVLHLADAAGPADAREPLRVTDWQNVLWSAGADGKAPVRVTVPWEGTLTVTVPAEWNATGLPAEAEVTSVAGIREIVVGLSPDDPASLHVDTGRRAASAGAGPASGGQDLRRPGWVGFSILAGGLGLAAAAWRGVR